MERSKLVKALLLEMEEVTQIGFDESDRECATLPCNYQGKKLGGYQEKPKSGECATLPCNYQG